MKVRELIELLSAYDPETVVAFAGAEGIVDFYGQPELVEVVPVSFSYKDYEEAESAYRYEGNRKGPNLTVLLIS